MISSTLLVDNFSRQLACLECASEERIIHVAYLQFFTAESILFSGGSSLTQQINHVTVRSRLRLTLHMESLLTQFIALSISGGKTLPIFST
jgi:hypothetical protein